jgi:hypothetical protein
MKISTVIGLSLVACWHLLVPTTSENLGPSSCEDKIDALEQCAETSIQSGDDILGSCADQRAEFEECVGAATPDEPLSGNLTLPPSTGLLTCYIYLAFYDACVAVTSTTGTNCPTSCIIDGPDQNCDDYDFAYCERQVCCTSCNTYMDEYNKCVANAGTCTLSNPGCVSGSFRLTFSSFALMTSAVVVALLMMF